MGHNELMAGCWWDLDGTYPTNELYWEALSHQGPIRYIMVYHTWLGCRGAWCFFNHWKHGTGKNSKIWRQTKSMFQGSWPKLLKKDVFQSKDALTAEVRRRCSERKRGDAPSCAAYSWPQNHGAGPWQSFLPSIAVHTELDSLVTSRLIILSTNYPIL